MISLSIRSVTKNLETFQTINLLIQFKEKYFGTLSSLDAKFRNPKK